MRQKNIHKKKVVSSNSDKTGKDGALHRSAYGEDIPICVNVKCLLRKKAKCYGFEGCPGFQAR